MLKMIKSLRRWFFSQFVFYRRLELRYMSWVEAEKIFREQNEVKYRMEMLFPGGSKLSKFWRIAEEENMNHIVGTVWLEFVERITE